MQRQASLIPLALHSRIAQVAEMHRCWTALLSTPLSVTVIGPLPQPLSAECPSMGEPKPPVSCSVSGEGSRRAAAASKSACTAAAAEGAGEAFLLPAASCSIAKPCQPQHKCAPTSQASYEWLFC